MLCVAVVDLMLRVAAVDLMLRVAAVDLMLCVAAVDSDVAGQGHEVMPTPSILVSRWSDCNRAALCIDPLVVRVSCKNQGSQADMNCLHPAFCLCSCVDCSCVEIAGSFVNPF